MRRVSGEAFADTSTVNVSPQSMHVRRITA
jgi:hypothetical protein